MPELLTRSVGVPGIDQRDDTGKDPRRCTEQERRHVIVAQSRSERWLRSGQYHSYSLKREGGSTTYEESVERQSHDVGRQREHHEPDPNVLHGENQAARSTLLLGIGIGLANILQHTNLRNMPLLLGEAARVVWQIGENDQGQQGKEHRDRTFDPEQPAPGGVAQRALHVGQDARADEGREGVGDEVAAKEDGVARGELAARVPLGQDEQGAGKERGLDEAQKEAHNDHAGEILHDARQGGDEAPDEHDGAEVQRRPRDAVDEHVGGDLHEDVADVENAQTGLVLGVVEAEVRLQALEAGGGDVVAVEVVHDVDGDEEGAARVEFALEALLDADAVLGRHVRDVEVGRLEVGRHGAGDDLEVLDILLGSMRAAEGGAGDLIAHDGCCLCFCFFVRVFWVDEEDGRNCAPI